MKLENVAVIGVGTTRFGVYPDRHVTHLARDAGLAALADAGIHVAESPASLGSTMVEAMRS